MPIKQIDHGTKEYKQMIDLRYEILRKPLHLSFESDQLHDCPSIVHCCAAADCLKM